MSYACPSSILPSLAFFVEMDTLLMIPLATPIGETDAFASVVGNDETVTPSRNKERLR